MDRKISIPFFGLTFVFFFLNWVFVQIGGIFTTWSSGFALLKGNQYTPGDPFTVIPLIASLVGIGLVFFNDRRGIIGSIAAGVIGALSLIWIRIATSMQVSSLQHAKIDNNSGIGDVLASSLSQGMVFKFTFVFYLTILLFIIAAAINLYYLLAQTNKNIAITRNQPSNVNNKFCTQCGTKNLVTTQFCIDCGSKLT